MKLATIALGALVILGALLLLAIVYGYAAEGAVREALSQDTYATSAQRSTTVCVGLFNLGCDTTQTSTATAERRTADDRPRSGLELLIVVSGCVVIMAILGMAVFGNEGEA